MNNKILTLDEIREKIRPVCEKYKISKVWIFGSYADGTARPDSDIDLIINETEKIKSLLDMVDTKDDFKKALNKEIDLISIEALEEKRHFSKIVKNYAKEIYSQYLNR